MTTIELPFPITVNKLFANAKGKGRVKTKRYRDWCEQAAWMILSQRPKAPSTPVCIDVELNPPTKRLFDLDNTSKCIFDALTRNKIIPEDDCRHVVAISTRLVSDGPPCRVIITPIQEGGADAE